MRASTTTIAILLALGFAGRGAEPKPQPESSNNSANPVDSRPAPPDLQAVERIWKSGQTLPADIAARFPNPPLQVPVDTGINVLVDLAHQCAFATMWTLPGMLHPLGFRSMVSHASLDTVLTPGKPSRMRVPVGKAADGKPLRSFGWVPNPQFDVLITFQADPNAQLYLPEERAAVETFVKEGGGVVILGNGIGRSDAKHCEVWADRSLGTTFGVDFKGAAAQPAQPLLGRDWEILRSHANGVPSVARRIVGKGRVVLVSSMSEFVWNGKTEDEAAKAEKRALLKDTVAWAAGGNAPVGGEARFPQTHGGGGGIYPELEERQKGVVVYYARNQKSQILDVVRKEVPKVTDKLFAWLPSPVPEEPMFVILAAGDGGGWAVNNCYPKETGTISLDAIGLLGIYAHELGHTMSGPRNAKGEAAGNHWIGGNQGEPHAGWWQGKILAMYSGNPAMRNCNKLFETDKSATEVDLGLLNDREVVTKWGAGKMFMKIWWIWQKLDDRYGTTWYPRWRWVQHTRWQNDPGRKLSMEETVEDMSIACGEDLFPFFKKVGTTLTRDRLETISFLGNSLSLQVAPLEVTPAGNARFDAIGDYTKPIPLPPPDPHRIPQ